MLLVIFPGEMHSCWPVVFTQYGSFSRVLMTCKSLAHYRSVYLLSVLKKIAATQSPLHLLTYSHATVRVGSSGQNAAGTLVRTGMCFTGFLKDAAELDTLTDTGSAFRTTGATT